MNNWFSKTVVLAGLLSAGLTACKKDETRVTAEFGTPPTLTTSTKSVVLARTNANMPALTYSWTPYTVSLSDEAKVASPVTYTLQLAKAGTNFATVQEISAGNSTASSLTIKTVDLNSAALGLKLPVDVASQVDVRLKTDVAGNLAPLYSAPSTLTVTPYDFCEQPAANQAWSLIGPAGMGWGTDIVMTLNCATGNYTYTGPLNADEFKFRYGGATPAVGSAWDANLGGKSSTGGDLTQGGDNLKTTTAGTYTVTLVKPTVKKGSDGKLAATGSFTIK